MKTASLSAVNPIVNTRGDQQLFANLMVTNTNGTLALADGIRVRFSDNYTAATTDDIEKISNFSENIAVYRDAKKWIVEKRPMIIKTDTIFLKLSNTGTKKYSFRIGAIDFVQTGVTAFLQDSWLNTNTPLELDGNTMDIDFAITSDPASANPDRFRIVFSAAPLTGTTTIVKAYQQNAAIAVEWKVSNQQNIQKYEVLKSTEGTIFNTVATQTATGVNGSDVNYNWVDANPATGDNYYRIRSTGTNGDIKYSAIVKVTMAKGNPAITVYPNPVTNRMVAVQFTDMMKGIYTLKLISSIGQVVSTQQVTHGGGNGTQSIRLDRGVANGTYKLEIIKPDNTVITRSLVITNR